MKGFPIFTQTDNDIFAEYNDKLYKCIDVEMWEKSQIFFSTPNRIDDEIWKEVVI